MRHTLDGRGSHSFQDLKDVGADLANVRNVAFCCGLIPVLNNVVHPMAMQTQDISDLPWMRWRAFEACVQEFKAVREDIERLRKYLRVLVLISPYLSDDAKAVRCWWMGYCFSAPCRQLHSGGTHLAAIAYGILWTGSFQGCDLVIAPGVVVKRNFEFAHPACFCGTKPQLVPGSAFRVRGGGEITDPSELRLRRWPARIIRAPWWVTRTLHSGAYWRESAACQDPYTELPRYQTFSRPDRGVCRMNGCKASVVVRETLVSLDKALEDLQCLWHDFGHNVQEYCLGDRGVSCHMQKLWRDMAVVWWLPDIVKQPQPGNSHVKALQSLYSDMKAELQMMPWPHGGYVSAPRRKEWPNKRGIVHFYRKWWAKVHQAAQGEYRTMWFPITHYMVAAPRQLVPVAFLCRAVVAAGSAAGLVARAAGQTSSGSVVLALMQRIGAFCATPFRMRASDLVDGPFGVGQMAKVRPRRATCKHTAAATAGRVWIVTCIHSLDQKRVAASLEQCADFAAGCYCINSWFCRCRRVGSTESPCERWVGCLKYLYNSITGPTTTTLTQRTTMRLAGIRGDGTDEAFVQALAAKMHEQSKTRAASKVLGHYAQAASASAAGSARGFMADAVGAMSTVAVVGTGRHGAAAVRNDRPCEQVPLAKEDVAFLEKVAKSAEKNFANAVTLPLFAYNKKQWGKDLDMLDKQRHAQERARAWIAKRPQPSKPKRGASTSSSSSSTSSSSSSSSSSEAPPPAVSAVAAEPPPAEAEPPASAAAAAAAAAAAPAAAEDPVAAGVAAGVPGDVEWILPPKGKLHLRVDVGDGSLILCQPWRKASSAGRAGSGLNTAPVGVKWCDKCMS